MGLVTLKRRAEYLGVRGGMSWGTPGFLIEGRARREAATGAASPGPRFGFTVTKKLGGAVVRNRIRRRLREAVRLHLAETTESAPSSPASSEAGPAATVESAGLETAAGPVAGWDYVIVARQAALTRPFASLRADLATAFDRLAKGRSRPGTPPKPRTGTRRPPKKLPRSDEI